MSDRIFGRGKGIGGRLRWFIFPITFLLVSTVFARANGIEFEFRTQVALAWRTHQTAEAVCADGNEAVINVLFENTEPDDPIKWSMDVIAEDLQSGKSVNLGTILPGETATGTINTGQASLNDGKVRFNLLWTNRSGSDARFADYDAVNCEPPPPEPECTVENFDLDVDVVNTSNTRAQLRASATWDNGPDHAFINWEFGGRTDTYGRGDSPITWDVDRLQDDYQLTVSAFVREGELICGTDSETVTIKARPKVPTPTPTEDPTPTATPTEDPTEEPTPEPTPEGCVKSDSAIFGSNNATFNMVGGDECIHVFAVYDTHGFANLQVPGAFQTLIGFSAGTMQTLEVPEYDPEDGCFVQLDAMVVSSFDEVASVVPEVLTNENQGPQFAALVNAETRGNHVCEEEPPEPGRPEKDVCPTCGPHRDEFGEEGTVVMAQTSATECVITWDEDLERYCNGMTPYPMVYAGGVPMSVLDLTTMIATPLEAFEGESFTHYFLEGDAIADPTWRTMKLISGLHEGQLTWWDLDPANPDRILSAWEVVGIDNVRMEYPCGRTPGVWDVTTEGNFNWSVGHNVSEVSLWAMDQYNLTYEDAVDWARQLSEAGVGAELPLPGVQTASVSTEEASVSSLSPDGSREAFLRDGNLWIRWILERSDDLPQEWDTGVAAESVESWDTNWVITITQDGESYQTDQHTSFLNLVEAGT